MVSPETSSYWSSSPPTVDRDPTPRRDLHRREPAPTERATPRSGDLRRPGHRLLRHHRVQPGGLGVPALRALPYQRRQRDRRVVARGRPARGAGRGGRGRAHHPALATRCRSCDFGSATWRAAARPRHCSIRFEALERIEGRVTDYIRLPGGSNVASVPGDERARRARGPAALAGGAADTESGRGAVRAAGGNRRERCRERHREARAPICSHRGRDRGLEPCGSSTTRRVGSKLRFVRALESVEH